LTENRLVLNLKQRRVYVYQGQKIIASYPVAIGRRGWETPTGQFTVIQMVQYPVWEHPFTGQLVPSGKNNPLGARWIGFWTDGQNFIGFHGTPQENLIGRAVSHGCVRMRDRDIKALFEKVKIGTSVTVIAK
jgi:lipoprotein-anchoring transpeptidase ErfK/SrfK